MAKVKVFDGADSIGGNKIHLDFDGRGLFFRLWGLKGVETVVPGRPIEV
jgi:hypothetical protein